MSKKVPSVDQRTDDGIAKLYPDSAASVRMVHNPRSDRYSQIEVLHIDHLVSERAAERLRDRKPSWEELHEKYMTYTLGEREACGKYKLLLEMCEHRDCLGIMIEREDGIGVACSVGWEPDENGAFKADMKELLRMMIERPYVQSLQLTDEDREEIALATEDLLGFVTTLPPIRVKRLTASDEELKELKARLQKEDPMLMEILRLLCFSEYATMTGAELAARLHVVKRTVINKTRRLKELSLVEAHEKRKGYRPTRDAHSLVGV